MIDVVLVMAYAVVMLLCMLLAVMAESRWMSAVFLIVAGTAVRLLLQTTRRTPADAHIPMTNERRQMMNRYDRQRTSCDFEEQ